MNRSGTLNTFTVSFVLVMGASMAFLANWLAETMFTDRDCAWFFLFGGLGRTCNGSKKDGRFCEVVKGG